MRRFTAVLQVWASVVRVGTPIWRFAQRVSYPIRPLLHLIAYYPLLLVVVLGLWSVVWGYMLEDYDAFHLVWHESWKIGIPNGVLVAFTLGVVTMAVQLADEKAATSSDAKKAVPADYTYRISWGVLLAAFACPFFWKQPFVFDDIFSLSNDWRWWFPLGLGLMAAPYFLGRALFPQTFQSTPKVGLLVLFVFGLLYAGMVAVHGFWPNTYCPFFPASVSVTLLLAFVTAFLGAVTFYAQKRRMWLYPILLLAVVLPFAFPQNQVENRLPNMTNSETNADYYKTPKRLVNIVTRSDLAESVRAEAGLPGGVRTAIRILEQQAKDRAEAGLLDDDETLKKWHERMKVEFGGPQPVVLVTCSGGASASAIYTADVLFTMEEQCPGFSRRIRLVSGASGGMLGAAYFVTQLRAGGLIAAVRKTPEYQAYINAVLDPNVPVNSEKFKKIVADYQAVMGDCRKEFFRRLEADFLSPLVQKWVHKDIPLSPFGVFSRIDDRFGYTTNDRGAALERSWSNHLKGALDVPFKQLKADEATGELPSLVLTPMMIEDGRQLIISNLDLEYMTESGTLPEKDIPMSYTGVEFFKLFPKADQFRLSTAVRMNASFPFFSPAAALPTDPVRHVVDAGYYDNFGMVVATNWMNHNRPFLQNQFRDSVVAYDEIPDVLLLRIRCFGNDQTLQMIPTAAEIREYAKQHGASSVPRYNELGKVRDEWAKNKQSATIRTEGGLFTVTAPLTGLFSAYRANMIYRSDERLNAAVTRMKWKDDGTRGIDVSAPLILCTTEPSLNWVLTDKDRHDIHTDVSRFLAKPSKDANRDTKRIPTPPVTDQATQAMQIEPKELTPTQRDSLDDKRLVGVILSKLPLSD